MSDTIRLSRLQKYQPAPNAAPSQPLYTIEANGANLRVTSNELHTPRKFFQLVREQIDIVVDPPPSKDWNERLRILLAGESFEFDIDLYAKD